MRIFIVFLTVAGDSFVLGLLHFVILARTKKQMSSAGIPPLPSVFNST